MPPGGWPAGSDGARAAIARVRLQVTGKTEPTEHVWRAEEPKPKPVDRPRELLRARRPRKPTTSEFGVWLRQHVAAAGSSMQELAEAAGINLSTMYGYSSGSKVPAAPRAIAIAHALKRSTEEVLQVIERSRPDRKAE